MNAMTIFVHPIASALLLILGLYPFFAFFVRSAANSSPANIFGSICFVFLAYRLYQLFKTGKGLKVPFYLMILGCFVLYTILSSIFLTSTLIEEGALKSLYANSFLHTFVAFLLIENMEFPENILKRIIQLLGVVLVIAALVSIIQISDPLFFFNDSELQQGLSYDRLQYYYANLDEDQTNATSRFFKGYRYSIYSWITGLSVGIDALAVFSLLMGIQKTTAIKRGVFVIAAGLISFLSSSRWIMLNFVIVASQNAFLKGNRIFNIVKYLLYAALFLFIIGTLANIVGLDIQKFVQERLLSSSAGTRIYAFEVFFKVFGDHPIFGTGGEDTEEMIRLITGRTSQIHVGYLKLFYYYGIVGGLIYLSFLGALFLQLWYRARASHYWGSFIAMTAFAVANLTLVELDLFYHGLLLALIFSNNLVNESMTGRMEPEFEPITQSPRFESVTS